MRKIFIYSYIESIKHSKIFIIPKGELEHFYLASKIDYLNITNKDKLFCAERNYLLGLPSTDVSSQYAEILGILKESIPFVNIDLLKHMRFTVIDFIQRVQTAVEKGDVTSLETLKTNGNIDYKTFSQILECRDGDFSVSANNQFSCKVYLKLGMVGEKKPVIFTDKTTAREFQFN